MLTKPQIDLVLPVHNEEASIASVLEEFYQITHDDNLGVRFVVSEDGSNDNTRVVVGALAEKLPILMLPTAPRKGYSKAVIDGLRATTAPLVAFSDSDGQCDPADLKRLYESLDHFDVVVGYRNPREDTIFRRSISFAFRLVYERLFPVRLRDPSCPFVLLRREAVEGILRGSPGLLPAGFWWEFNARASAAKLRITEIPVSHRARQAGKTQVYRLPKLARLAGEHLLALFALRRELRLLQCSAPT